MITEYDTEIATIVLPSEFDEELLEVINAQAGSGTIIEINSSTELLIDYSLCEFETMQEAFDHISSIIRDIKETA
tara:strand:- start:465 stop:689 length:225 start_codon:yes stop_codon:yes gene_type:complete